MARTRVCVVVKYGFAVCISLDLSDTCIWRPRQAPAGPYCQHKLPLDSHPFYARNYPYVTACMSVAPVAPMNLSVNVLLLIVRRRCSTTVPLFLF